MAAYASARKDRRLVEALAGGVSYGVGNHPFSKTVYLTMLRSSGSILGFRPKASPIRPSLWAGTMLIGETGFFHTFPPTAGRGVSIGDSYEVLETNSQTFCVRI